MVMLQLQPDQITILWDSIKETMLMSNLVPPDREEQYLNNVLEKCLSGKLSCWVIFQYVGEEKEIYSIVIMSINEDRLFGYRYVVVEGIFGYRKMTEEMACELGVQLKTYAKNVKCSAVKALTSSPKAMRICELTGAVNVGVVYSLEV